MEKAQALKILATVKGVWPRQPADDPTIMVWAELLAEVGFAATVQAVREFIDQGTHEAPSIAEIRKLALVIEQNEAERQRRARKALMEPPPSEGEMAENKASLRELIDAISQKFNLPEKLRRDERERTAVAHAEIAAKGGIDAEVEHAQRVIESRRGEKAVLADRGWETLANSLRKAREDG